MLARSSALLSSSVLVVLLGGCDLVFGVTGQPEPCELASFEHAQESVIADAQAFSVDWDQTFAVIYRDPITYELSLPAGEMTPIDIGVYNPVSVALAPEGTAMLYTISVEPMELRGALRGDGAAWQLDATVPRGTFAGTPSADAFGPRRVLVRMTAASNDVQEYVVDDAGHWVTSGEPFEVASMLAPNLTPNGLTMAYATDEGVFAVSRDDVESPWGAPVLLRAGAYLSPQLCDRCQRLYTIGEGSLRRYDR